MRTIFHKFLARFHFQKTTTLYHEPIVSTCVFFLHFVLSIQRTAPCPMFHFFPSSHFLSSDLKQRVTNHSIFQGISSYFLESILRLFESLTLCYSNIVFSSLFLRTTPNNNFLNFRFVYLKTGITTLEYVALCHRFPVTTHTFLGWC